MPHEMYILFVQKAPYNLPLTDEQNIMPHEMYILFVQKAKHYPAMDIQIESAPASETCHVKGCMLKINMPHRQKSHRFGCGQ